MYIRLTTARKDEYQRIDNANKARSVLKKPPINYIPQIGGVV